MSYRADNRCKRRRKHASTPQEWIGGLRCLQFESWKSGAKRRENTAGNLLKRPFACPTTKVAGIAKRVGGYTQAWRKSGPCPRKGVKPGGIPETARICRRAALAFRGAAILQGRAFLAWAFRSMSSASRTASTVFNVGLPCSLKERYNCSRERPVSFAN